MEREDNVSKYMYVFALACYYKVHLCHQAGMTSLSFLQPAKIAAIRIGPHHCDRAMPPFSPTTPAKKTLQIESGHQPTVITASQIDYLLIFYI